MKKIYQTPLTEIVHVITEYACLQGASPVKTADYTKKVDGDSSTSSIDVGEDDPTDVNPARGFSFSWEEDWE